MKNRFDTALNWDDLRIFLAVAQTGSLTEAARVLEVGVATVSRRLERLESSVGRRLFQRSATGLTLSRDAEPLLDRAEAVMGGVFDFLRASEADDPHAGIVTINTLDTVVDRLLAPAFARFRVEHPRIQLVLRASARIVSLSQRTADIAIRVARPAEDRVVRQKLETLEYGVYAAPAYLARRGRPANPNDLAGHDIATYEERLDGMPEAAWLLERVRPVDVAFRLTTLSGILATIEHGAAIGILPRFMAGPELVCLWDGPDLPRREVWLATHEDVRDLPRVRSVINFIKRTFADASAC